MRGYPNKYGNFSERNVSGVGQYTHEHSWTRGQFKYFYFLDTFWMPNVIRKTIVWMLNYDFPFCIQNNLITTKK